MFLGEVLIVLAILVLTRRIAGAARSGHVRLDLVGTVLSALGLALVVFGILRAGAWGLVLPKPEAPQWLGLSPTVWLVLAGGVVVWLFLEWENRQLDHGREPLVDPGILRNRGLQGGLISFFSQYLLQAGLFFRYRCSCRSRSGSRRSKRACACCRSRSRC